MGKIIRQVSVAVWVMGLCTPSIALAQRKPATKTVTPAEDPAPSGDGPAPEVLSDDAELARVVSLVEAAKYDQCAAELERLLDPKSKRKLLDPAVVETARVYQATCYIG